MCCKAHILVEFLSLYVITYADLWLKSHWGPFLSVNIESDNLFLCSAVDQYLDYNYVLCNLKIPGVINHPEISIYHNMCIAWSCFI